MKTRKFKVGTLLILATITLATTSCKKEGCTDPNAINYSDSAKKDDGSCKYASSNNDDGVVYITENISENTTWTSDKVHILSTRVAVLSGATLTIEPGTIIKGEVGSGPNATALIIARGAKIMAEGTAD